MFPTAYGTEDFCRDKLTKSLPIESCYSVVENVDKFVPVKCPISNKSMGCFSIASNSTYGCVSNLNDEARKSCETSELCKICYKNNCNKPYTECYQCNSIIDVDCIEVSNKTQTEKCEAKQSKCITGIDVHGVTHRGCSKTESIDSKEFKELSACSSNLCNSMIFPKTRQKCYKRDKVNDDPVKIQFCKLYRKYDECYSYRGSKYHFIPGKKRL